jgi:hypothetical protein
VPQIEVIVAASSSRRLGVRAVGIWSILFCLAASLSACTHRDYTLSPIQGITQIDVDDDYDNPSASITDKAQVARIVAFLNARLDRWYDPEYRRFPTTGAIHLHGPSNWVVVEFGPGGMHLTRKGMTYTDSVKTQDFRVIRTTDSFESLAALCGLLGPRFHTSCVFKSDRPPTAAPRISPRPCPCDGKHTHR